MSAHSKPHHGSRRKVVAVTALLLSSLFWAYLSLDKFVGNQVVARPHGSAELGLLAEPPKEEVLPLRAAPALGAASNTAKEQLLGQDLLGDKRRGPWGAGVAVQAADPKPDVVSQSELLALARSMDASTTAWASGVGAEGGEDAALLEMPAVTLTGPTLEAAGGGAPAAGAAAAAAQPAPSSSAPPLVSAATPVAAAGAPAGGAAPESQSAAKPAASGSGATAAGAGAAAAASTAQGQRLTQLCANTCATADNGVCEEGRPGKAKPLQEGQRDAEVYPASCDLGTDCADCGSWESAAEAQAWEPVRAIKAKGFTVNVRQVDVPQPFWIAYADPEVDLGASAELHANAVLDGGDTWVWYRILEQGCVGPDGRSRLALDVGAKGFGYFALLAASLGCRVIAWEPVPYFAEYLKLSLALNKLAHLVEVRSKVVSSEAEKVLPVLVPKKGWWVTAGVHGVNMGKVSDDPSQFDKIEVETEQLDSVVQEDVVMLVMDMQGFEPSALKSAKNLLQKFKVQHLTLEYSPAGWERGATWDRLKQYPDALARLLNSGYVAFHLTEVIPAWEKGLPSLTLDRITPELLRYDIEDVYRLANGKLGCPLPDDLAYIKGVWACNAIPEALHPYSFRSTFESSTRVWAARKDTDPALLPTTGLTSSLFQLDQDLQAFDTPRAWGSGRRLCEGVQPAQQVATRCKCGEQRECAKVEALVHRLAEQGKMPPLDPPEAADVAGLQLSNWS